MYALIIPVYKNELNIPGLLEAVRGLHGALGGRLTVTYVVDGSPDRSQDLLLEALAKEGMRTNLILHSRNFGSFAAIRTGLEQTEADYYAVMAADLQEPPELILEFFRKMESESVDLVLGTRDGRADPPLSKVFSWVFWRLYKRFINKDTPKGGVDIFGCNRQVRDKVLEFGEAKSSLVAQLLWVGFKRSFVKYDRRARELGKSAWTFRKKLDYMMDSVFAFTDLPIKLLMNVGIVGVLASFIVGAVALVSKLVGLTSVSGYTALMIAIVFFGAVNTLGLGIVGSYAQRTYENTKARPLSIVARKYEFNKD